MSGNEPTIEGKNHHYDGAIYANVVERLLGGLHGLITRQVDPDARVLDAGCATGGLSFRLATTCSEVVGIDISPKNIRFAEKRRAARSVSNLRFELADATHLDAYAPDSFDLACLVMVIHEMPADQRVPVLRELTRVAREMLIVDFAVPMPWNFAGLRNRAVEIAAGPNHYRSFRDYVRRGGLPPMLAEAGIEIEATRPVDAGTLVLARSGAASAPPATTP